MSRLTILLTGANGQVGRELAPLLAALGEVVATDRNQLDLADRDAVVETMRRVRPAIVVNAAAYTAVDAAESHAGLAFAINAEAPALLAEEARRTDALLVHYSTDYVFDGTSREPYRETSPTNPINVYGASKLEGEHRIAQSGARALVFRTSWVYGLHGRNFLLTIRRLAAERDRLAIVDDQVGVPNWSRALARATARVLAMGRTMLDERAGVYHLSCSGDTTWFGFAQAFLGEGTRARLDPITTDAYPTPARRPAYGVLDTSAFRHAFGFALPHWRDALAECLGSAADPQATAVG